MRILHLGKYFPPYAGGMETYLRDLMAAQARQGLEPAALVHRSSISLHSEEELYPAGEERLPVTRAAVWARFLFTPLSPTFPWLLRRHIQQHKPDILHIHMPNVSAFWALCLPAARGIPWVIHWQADVLASRHNLGLRVFYLLYRPFERAILRRSKAIIATSPPYLESSISLQSFRDKCHVIPLGLDPTSLPGTTLTQPDQTADTPLRVLAIGRLTYYKGLEYLIRAAAQVDQVELHLVGSGDLEAELRSLAQGLKLGTRITFHGHLPNEQLAAQISACDCLCLPSIERTEAFGVVLLEAMAGSRATIISDVPGSGMGWVVDNHITGLHVTPADPGALAAAMTNLQRDRDNIKKMGANGRQKFDRLFHIDKSAEGVAGLYQLVLTALTDQQQAQL